MALYMAPEGMRRRAPIINDLAGRRPHKVVVDLDCSPLFCKSLILKVVVLDERKSTTRAHLANATAPAPLRQNQSLRPQAIKPGNPKTDNQKP